MCLHAKIQAEKVGMSILVFFLAPVQLSLRLHAEAVLFPGQIQLVLVRIVTALYTNSCSSVLCGSGNGGMMMVVSAECAENHDVLV